MIFRQGLLACIILLGLLTGCALSPQQLTPNPAINQSLPQVGSGQAVNIRVADGRNSPIIGTRGGLYPATSTISLSSGDIVPKLQQQAEQALGNMGYSPQAEGAAIQLNIVVDSITYKPSDSSFANAVSIQAILRAQLQTADKTYNGRYTSNISQSFTSAPDLATNNSLVAEALSNALISLFKDTRLTDAM